MPSAPKEGSKSKSWFVGFRLNENDPTAKYILERIEALKNKQTKAGYHEPTDGDLFCSAFMEAYGNGGNQEPPYTMSVEDKIEARLASIENNLDNFQDRILDVLRTQLRGIDLSSFKDENGGTLESTIEQNLDAMDLEALFGGVESIGGDDE